MVFNEVVSWKIIFLWLLLTHRAAATIEKQKGDTQDQTTTRANTLYDDADDLQKQLDNEARDKLKYGKPKTIWVLHLPTPFPDISYFVTGQTKRVDTGEPSKFRKKCQQIRQQNSSQKQSSSGAVLEWDYQTQYEWKKMFPECGSRWQSPIDLPVQGFIKARGARNLMFTNFDVKPEKITVKNDGRRVLLYGNWGPKQMPVVHGGAAHSRRYLFHSMSIMWPSEHTIGGLQYPMESQAIHISAEYKTMQEALDAAPNDPQAFLGIVNIYKYGDHTQVGLQGILDVVLRDNTYDASGIFHPLNHFVPPFKEYASYQGSLTAPPCTESVLWLIRARSLPVTRNVVTAIHRLQNPYGEPHQFAVRVTQPLNDRKLYLFN